MRSSLFDYEWQFLTQMITRIHYTASYEELCRLLLEDQLPTLIPFDRAVVFQTGRQNGQGTVAAPYTVGMPNDPKKNPFLDRAVIPRWSRSSWRRTAPSFCSRISSPPRTGSTPISTGTSGSRAAFTGRWGPPSSTATARWRWWRCSGSGTRLTLTPRSSIFCTR